MKIVYVVHQFYPKYCSGTESVTYQLANMAQIAGHRVAVVAYQPDNDIQSAQKYKGIRYARHMYKKLSITECCHQHLPLDITYSVENSRMLSFAKMYLNKEKPDIVHVTHLMRVAPFIQAAKDLGIPCVVTLTDATAICPRIALLDKFGAVCKGCDKGERCKSVCNELHDYALRLQTVRSLLEGTELLAAPSRYLAETIGKELGLDIQVYPHGLDMTSIKRNADEDRDCQTIRMGWFGSLVEHKGLELVLRAMKTVKASNLRLDIYGSGTKEYEKYLRTMSENDERIVWNGWKSKNEVYEAYSSLDVVIVSSICNESFSLAKNEAISWGIPVIVSNLGALPENIEHEIDGFVFDPFNEDELGEILQAISQQPELIKQMAVRTSTKTVLSIEQEFFRYQSVYLDSIGC